MSLPENFLWGGATAANQCEGAYNCLLYTSIYYTTLGKDLAEAEAEKEKLAEALKPIME